MRVYVNEEARELHVVDRLTGFDYAKQVVTGQNMITTDELGNFCMTEDEYKSWQHLLAIEQDSEDVRYALTDCVDKQELDDYIYEETRYLTDIQEVVDTENMVLHDLQKALEAHNTAWLQENGFIKTAHKE